jgi:hypothetical protein
MFPPPNYSQKLQALKTWFNNHRVPIISAANALAILFGTSLIAALSMGHLKYVAEAQAGKAQASSSDQDAEMSPASQPAATGRKKHRAAQFAESRGAASAAKARHSKIDPKTPVKAQAPPPPPPKGHVRLPGQQPFNRTNLSADDAPDDSDTDEDTDGGEDKE